MPIKMPKNAQGQPADPSNEAHVIGVHAQAHDVLLAEHGNQVDQAGLDALMVAWRTVAMAGMLAADKARRGDAYWRTAVEAGNKSILDYWNGSEVGYPQIINHANASSKYSFLLYLTQSLITDGQVVMMETHSDLFIQTAQVLKQIRDDKHWIVNSISELVG